MTILLGLEVLVLLTAFYAPRRRVAAALGLSLFRKRAGFGGPFGEICFRIGFRLACCTCRQYWSISYHISYLQVYS